MVSLPITDHTQSESIHQWMSVYITFHNWNIILPFLFNEKKKQRKDSFFVILSVWFLQEEYQGSKLISALRWDNRRTGEDLAFASAVDIFFKTCFFLSMGKSNFLVVDSQLDVDRGNKFTINRVCVFVDGFGWRDAVCTNITDKVRQAWCRTHATMHD